MTGTPHHERPLRKWPQNQRPMGARRRENAQETRTPRVESVAELLVTNMAALKSK